MPYQYGVLDRFIIEFDKAITTLSGTPSITTGRASPDKYIEQDELEISEKANSRRLMRVNHAGEVSAQALYQGQALTAKLADVKEAMNQAAVEENDHLIWCEQRLRELGGRPSLFNPFWYIGSFTIGAAAGKISDSWSLGFVAETEKQVVKHLDRHLTKLSHNDKRSRAILETMRLDEQQHGLDAVKAGGAKLPKPVTVMMSCVSKIMTKTSSII